MDDSSWTMIIRPKRKWLDLRLSELWQSKELIRQFVWRDFVSVYKQTILGPLWYVVQALFTAITMTVIFGKVAKLPTDGLPQFLFYLSGTAIWSYFSACLNKTASTFKDNANLFGKVYFPRLIVPISILVSNLITFVIQFGLFVGFLIYFKLARAPIYPNSWILFTPVLIMMMAGLGLGFGIIVSSLTTRYRDLQYLVTFGVQLLMYFTPIVYPLSTVKGKFRILLLANPMTSIVECFRYAFLGAGTVNIYYLLYSLGFMFVVLTIGILIFNRVEATFMDTV